MFIYNYVKLHIKLFILSPVFLYLLSFFAFFLYISFDYTLLCDGETLEELKSVLDSEIVKYENALNDYADALDSRIDEERFAKEFPLFGDEERIKKLDDKTVKKLGEAAAILYKIRKTEKSIKALEADFKSIVDRQDFFEGRGRVNRG